MLNSSDPLGTGTLSILPGANFDGLGYNNAAAPHQPDNIESTKNAVFFQEDPGSHNAQPANPAATNARIWRYDLATGISTVVAEVDQSMSPVVNRGTWHSSGIVDASAVFGPEGPPRRALGLRTRSEDQWICVFPPSRSASGEA
ncbi:MAG: hypothetical protein WD805_01950 [Gaiellaceae bacterium]